MASVVMKSLVILGLTMMSMPLIEGIRYTEQFEPEDQETTDSLVEEANVQREREGKERWHI